ncbi:MAG: hypothetical protein R2939_06710 [Kofleriaceae bacterium]
MVLRRHHCASVGAGVVVARYVLDDPFEYDIKQLRPRPAALDAREWMAVSSTPTSSGAASPARPTSPPTGLDQVPRIVDALRAVDRGVPERDQTIGTVQSILDAIPLDQDRRLEVLAEIPRAARRPRAGGARRRRPRRDRRALRPPTTLRPSGRAGSAQEPYWTRSPSRTAGSG